MMAKAVVELNRAHDKTCGLESICALKSADYTRKKYWYEWKCNDIRFLSNKESHFWNSIRALSWTILLYIYEPKKISANETSTQGEGGGIHKT